MPGASSGAGVRTQPGRPRARLSFDLCGASARHYVPPAATTRARAPPLQVLGPPESRRPAEPGPVIGSSERAPRCLLRAEHALHLAARPRPRTGAATPAWPLDPGPGPLLSSDHVQHVDANAYARACVHTTRSPAQCSDVRATRTCAQIPAGTSFRLRDRRR